jgi:D-glycero-alpha-D-manno-heptose-7-phosphate kinase
MMELQSNLFLLFYLNKKRSAGDILKVQNKKTNDNNDDVINRLHKIKDIGLYTKKILEQNKINEFGEILHEHWLIKKGISKKISDPFIDEVYECAIKNGALGGKVIGAGGGGFLLFLLSV